jgi:hypothetical protein
VGDVRALGPLYALVLTIDRDLLLSLSAVNLVCAVVIVAFTFRDRPGIERALMATGVFTALSVLSIAGMHLFARTPVREISVFVMD